APRKSLTSSNRYAGASMVALQATSATGAKWMSPSRSVPGSSRTACFTCKQRPASSPIQTPRRNGWKPKPRRAQCCERPSKSSTAWTNPSERSCDLLRFTENTMLLMLDNYDSFTYNLVQYFGELGEDVRTHRNDQITVAEIEAMQPDRICISPGPCTPNEAGISIDVIRHFAGKVPILGVCLGHQAIGAAFGGDVVRARELMHGKVSEITHRGTDVFADLPSPFTVTRYHSLAVARDTLPDCLEITAETADGEIMGLRHTSLPIYGVQFHPESILSEHGHALLQNFLNIQN